LESFFRGLHPKALDQGRKLAERFDFKSLRHLLDIAGGSGGFSIGACEICPELHATVAELPTVCPITNRFVKAAGFSDRVTALPHDIVREPLATPHDAAVLRAFVQVLSREDAARALSHVGQSLRAGAFLLIIGRILDDDRLRPETTVGFNLVFLNVYDEGQAYTESEYRRWLADAGFVDVQRETQQDGTSFITALNRT
jgi:hypothetical protein